MNTSRNQAHYQNSYNTIDNNSRTPTKSMPKINVLAPNDSIRTSRNFSKIDNHRNTDLIDTINDRDTSFTIGAGKNKSIRRVMDLDKSAITLPEFRLDMEKNSDDILR